jgi:cbb3-type cytochrome oxidase maturation protein
LGFVLAFIWAVRSGQYDDDYTPSVRMLFDSKKMNHEEPTDMIDDSKPETKQE